MSTISTHVLDTSRGRPASAVAVNLLGADGALLGTGETDTDGRLAALGPEHLEAGDYRLRFLTGEYFVRHGLTSFYPVVTIDFTITEPEQHYHVPLLLSPFAFSTYRGS